MSSNYLVEKDAVTLYRGTFNGCWQYVCAQYGNMTITDLLNKGFLIRPANDDSENS
jgi:hypothetical protein